MCLRIFRRPRNGQSLSDVVREMVIAMDIVNVMARCVNSAIAVHAAVNLVVIVLPSILLMSQRMIPMILDLCQILISVPVKSLVT